MKFSLGPKGQTHIELLYKKSTERDPKKYRLSYNARYDGPCKMCMGTTPWYLNEWMMRLCSTECEIEHKKWWNANGAITYTYEETATTKPTFFQ